MTGVVDYAPDPTSRWSFFTLALGRSSPGTAITRVGVDSAGTSRTDVVVPSGIDAGDLLLVHAAHEDSSYALPATPTGWSLLGTENAAFSDACSSIFYKAADGSEDGTTVDFIDAVTGAPKKKRTLVVYRGASGISAWASADNGAGVDGPAVTPPDGAMIAGFMCVWSGSYNPSPLTASYVDTGDPMTVLWSIPAASANGLFAVELGLTPPTPPLGWLAAG